jgi:hypothetical protein
MTGHSYLIVKEGLLTNRELTLVCVLTGVFPNTDARWSHTLGDLMLEGRRALRLVVGTWQSRLMVT